MAIVMATAARAWEGNMLTMGLLLLLLLLAAEGVEEEGEAEEEEEEEEAGLLLLGRAPLMGGLVGGLPRFRSLDGRGEMEGDGDGEDAVEEEEEEGGADQLMGGRPVRKTSSSFPPPPPSWLLLASIIITRVRRSWAGTTRRTASPPPSAVAPLWQQERGNGGRRARNAALGRKRRSMKATRTGKEDRDMLWALAHAGPYRSSRLRGRDVARVGGWVGVVCGCGWVVCTYEEYPPRASSFLLLRCVGRRRALATKPHGVPSPVLR